jgi:TonB family protein
MTPAALLDVTVRTSVVLLVALAALAAASLLGRGSAAARHWFLAATIAGAALVPALQLAVPRWQLTVATLGARVPAVAVAPRTETDVVARPVSPAAPRAPGVPGPRAPWTAPALIVPVWLAGVGIAVLALGAGFVRLGRIAAQATECVSPIWTQLASRISHEYGLGRPVTVLQSRHPSLLVTWGLRRATVILPAQAVEWSEARAGVVLYHELAHVHRRDWVIQMAAEAFRAVFWFNPLAWMASRRLRLESEQACDDAVLERGIAAEDYATHLVDLARALHVRASSFVHPPAPAMARPSSLRTRIAAMLDATRNRRPFSRLARFATVAALLGISALAASAQTSLATLWGVVSDQRGAVIGNTTVTLSDTASSRKWEVKSDATGRFEIVGLPASDYVLTIAQPGFQSTKQPVTVVTGQTLRHDVSLQIGRLQETLMVTGSEPASGAGAAKRDAPDWATAPCTPAAQGGSIRPPARLSDERPEYPPGLRSAHVGGVVVLRGLIGTDGSFRELDAEEPSNPDLAQAAIVAVRQWRFSPTLLDCAAVEVPITVTVDFSMEGR